MPCAAQFCSLTRFNYSTGFSCCYYTVVVDCVWTCVTNAYLDLCVGWISVLFFCFVVLFFVFSVVVHYSWFSDRHISFYPQIKHFLRTCQLGQHGIFYHPVQQYKLEGPINLSTKQSFFGFWHFVLKVSCILFVTVVVLMKTGLRRLKKLSLLRKSASLQLKKENPTCFVLPLTIQRVDGNTNLYLFSAAGLGFSYSAAFIEILMPSRALLSSLSARNATWATSF